MKRIISLVCVFALVISVMATVQITAFAAADSYDLNADTITVNGVEYKKVGYRMAPLYFEDGNPGTALYDATGADTSVHIVDFATDSGKADTANHGNVIKRPWTKERVVPPMIRFYNDQSAVKGSGDVFVLNFDIFYEKFYNGTVFSFKLFNESGSAAWNSNFASLKLSDGAFVLNNTYSKSIAVNEWHNVILFMDFNNKKIGLIVDGTPVALNIDMGDKTVTGLCSIEYNPYNASSNNENIYIDNVAAYRYAENIQSNMNGISYPLVNSFDMKNMAIRIEAEDMVSSSNMVLVEDASASGGYAMKSLSDREYNLGNPSSAADFQVKPNADLMANINIPITTTYKVWARVKTAGTPQLNAPVWLRFDDWSKYIGKNIYPFPSVSKTTDEQKYIEYPYNYRLKFVNKTYANHLYSNTNAAGIPQEYMWVLLNNASEYINVDDVKFRHANEPAALLKNGNRELALLFGDKDFVIDQLYIVATDTIDSSSDAYKWKPTDMNPSIADSGIEPHNIFPTTNVPVMELAGVHPRLFITEDEIPAYKEKLNHPFFSTTYAEKKRLGLQDVNCLLPADNSCYSKHGDKGSALQARAWLYLLGEVDKSHARKTVDELKNLLSTVTFEIPNDTTYNTRNTGTVMVTAAMVYDWCYDVMNDSDREFIIRKLKEYASVTEVGFPPVRRGLISSHPQEELIYLHDAIVGIAVYDEDPQWYDITMSVIFDRMIPIREFASQSGYDFSMGSYFEARNKGPLYLDKMLHVVGALDEGEALFGENHMNSFDHLIYRGLPSGTWFKDGDDYHWSGHDGYNKVFDTAVIPMYVGAEYDNPYLAAEGLQTYTWNGSSVSIMDTFMIDTNAETKFMCELPTSYRTTYPMTTVVARTGWNQGMNSPDAVVFMDMHDAVLDGHEHGDAGSFQLYYKGMLALDSGFYEYCDHYYHYQSRSIAHNVMLIDNGNDDFYQLGSSANSSTNDGGQKNMSLKNASTLSGFEALLNKVDENGNITSYGERQVAYEKAHYIGPNAQTPAFTYISSDISGAYNYQNAKSGQTEPEKKVEDSGYERSMVFMDLYDDEFPAAFIVYDNVSSLDANYKKTWLLHSQLEPTVNGNVSTILRTDNGQNGKLVNTTMYPKSTNLNIEIVGGEGKEFWVGGKNWPYITDHSSKQVDDGAYRLEISPRAAATDDIFLNAMYVTDADNENTLPMDMIEGTAYVGVSVKDRIVTFSKSRDNISSSFTLTIPDKGYDEVYCLLTDLRAGKWRISGNGSTFYVQSKADSNPADHYKDGEYSIVFKAAPGTYTIAPTTANNAVTAFTMPTAEIEQYGDFRIRNNNNLMYLPKPTKLVDGDGDGELDTYAAIDGVFTQLGADITEVNGDTLTFTYTESNGTVNTYEFTAGATTYKKNGTVVTASSRILKRPPLMINGEMYADLRDFYYVLSYTAQASYNSTGKYLHLRTRYEGGKVR